MMEQVYSVSQVNFYIKDLFEQNRMLERISIRGEVSGCKYHSSGHIYFTLKDAGGQLGCVMFAGNRASGLSFQLKDGQSVTVSGNISVYERDGKYQLYAKRITQGGIGLLYQQFLEQKKRLEAAGYFSNEVKKPIPAYPKTIGIVTADTGAAIQDIRNIAGRRNPYVQLILCPAKVQGAGAGASIAAGIRRLDQMGLDVLIVGRGGGSMEDLWAFNEEEVAKAIWECQTPVISAVGHETDVTIADFVADLRAPTPSAAAELAIPRVEDMLERLMSARNRLAMQMENKLRRLGDKLEQKRLRLMTVSPAYRLRQQRQRHGDLQDRLMALMEARLEAAKHRLALSAERLNGCSPLARLASGYAYVAGEDGRAIRSVEQLAPGDKLRIHLIDGKAVVQIKEIEEKKGEGRF